MGLPRKLKKYSITRAVLDILYDLGQAVDIDTPFHNTRRSWAKARAVPLPQKWRYKRAIQYLKKRAELHVMQRHGRTFLKLTRKGELAVLMNRIDQDFKKHGNWDGKWRLIIWDIPEISSIERNRLRRLVKDLNFYRLQQSVFITPYPLPISAVEFLKSSKLIKYIRFLRVDKIEDDGDLRNYYDL